MGFDSIGGISPTWIISTARHRFDQHDDKAKRKEAKDQTAKRRAYMMIDRFQH